MFLLEHFRNRRLNRVVKVLTLSDTLSYSAWNLVTPILGVYIADEITGGNLAVVGTSATLFLILNGVLQLPVSMMLDRNRGELDDFKALIIGSFIVTLTAFMYLFSSQVWHIYLIQAIAAIGTAITYPAWMAIFSRHLDKGQEGYEWTLYSSIVGFGGAITASIGAIIAEKHGYQWVFILVGLFSLSSTISMIFIRDKIRKR